MRKSSRRSSRRKDMPSLGWISEQHPGAGNAGGATFSNGAGSFRRYLVLLFLVPFGYLMHVCVMPYLSIGGITPNLLFAIIGIVTVAYGRVQALWVGLIYGLLMEIMVPSVPCTVLIKWVICSKILLALALHLATSLTKSLISITFDIILSSFDSGSPNGFSIFSISSIVNTSYLDPKLAPRLFPPLFPPLLPPTLRISRPLPSDCPPCFFLQFLCTTIQPP